MLAHIGEIGDAADIDHADRQRPAKLAHQRAVEHRGKRSALPARRDVGRAQVEHHRDAQPRRQRPPIAELDRQQPLGRMQHGLAMKPDHRDGARAQPVGR